MINRLALFFLSVFTLITFGGCVAGQSQRIDMSTLSPEEGEKVKAVRLVEAGELDKISYKFIKKVQGLSCEVWKRTKMGIIVITWERVNIATREEAEEQLKIKAVRAGANAISNIVCVAESNFMTRSRLCWRHFDCSADAIQVD